MRGCGRGRGIGRGRVIGRGRGRENAGNSPSSRLRPFDMTMSSNYATTTSKKQNKIKTPRGSAKGIQTYVGARTFRYFVAFLLLTPHELTHLQNSESLSLRSSPQRILGSFSYSWENVSGRSLLIEEDEKRKPQERKA